MTVQSANRLSLVRARGGGITGRATIAGSTARDPGYAVELTVHRRSPEQATLSGSVSRWDNGRTALAMTRKGRVTEILGRIGFQPGFSEVSLRVERESFARSTVTGVLCNRDVSLTIERVEGVITVSGKLGAYEQSAIGSVALVIRESGEGRTFEGGTSRESEGRVRLDEVRDGDVRRITGKLGGWDVTSLCQPVHMRDLELFDTTLLIVLTQAVRRWMATI